MKKRYAKVRLSQEKRIRKHLKGEPLEEIAQEKIDFFKSECKKFEQGKYKTFESKNDYKIWKAALEEIDKCIAEGMDKHVSSFTSLIAFCSIVSMKFSLKLGRNTLQTSMPTTQGKNRLN